MKHVHHDIDENVISQVPVSLELPIQRLWRIKSRQSNKFTTLIRVITEDTAIVDFLLNNDLTLFGKRHQCETSKNPSPFNAPSATNSATTRPLAPTNPRAPNAPKPTPPTIARPRPRSAYTVEVLRW
ncbi:hypothetical protein MTP99_009153 [Tenebrio molitor]|nr:hypothetical protein MTP99_009153 [Tenebrio molitor]